MSSATTRVGARRQMPRAEGMSTAAPNPVVVLDVYGLAIELGGDWPELVDQVRRDFAWFERAGNEDPARAASPAVRVEVERRRPDYDSFGPLRASFVTPRNVVYQRDERTIVDYFGRAVSVLDRESNTLTIQGEDEHLVHEAAYHFLLSRIGEHVESRGLPRLHALALAGRNGAVAVILPSGGGKSTMALRAIEEEGVRLLSEDSPLIDRRGRIHPFPLRIGVNPGEADGLPPQRVRRLERMEFHPKLLLDVEHFVDHVEARPRPLRHLVIGRRNLGTEACLEPLARRFAAGPLFREAVVGVGLYQGMEFVLQRGAWDVLRQARPAAIRASCCAAGLARARVWSLECGRDHDRNWSTLRALLG
jgi:hypothetical protein